MITTHNAIRAFMERNMFAPQPRAQPEENFDDLIGETTQGAFTGFPYQDRPHIPEYCGIKKPKGRPPGKHNLRSKGKTTVLPVMQSLPSGESFAFVNNTGVNNPEVQSWLNECAAILAAEKAKPENFDGLI